MILNKDDSQSFHVNTIDGVVGSLCAGKGQIPPELSLTYAMTVETFFSVAEECCPTLKQRDYKDPPTIVYTR